LNVATWAAAALGQSYPVAGGLPRPAVNDKADARTPLALVFASVTLALCLMFLTGLLENLPKAVLAALASVILLLIRASQPHVAFLARIPRTGKYSDIERHPDREPLPHTIAFRPKANLIYVNAEPVLKVVLDRVEAERADVRRVICDLSACP
jgi:MFS superfamily sulfate permease-like transporter